MNKETFFESLSCEDLELVTLECAKEEWRIRNEFDPVLDAVVYLDATQSPDNWRCDRAECDGKTMTMSYDCEPLGDQLRAYVTRGPMNTLLSVRVVGE